MINGNGGSAEAIEMPVGHVNITDRTRTSSTSSFQDLTNSSAAQTMRKELDKLVTKVKDANEREGFAKEMDSFFHLFSRYLARAKDPKLVWEKVVSPRAEQILPYASISKAEDPKANKDLLNKLAVLKLNGGLGTTMGCVGPKSAIEVRDGLTFLDLTVRQIEHLNSSLDVDVPFILMNSFNTDDETKRIIQKYSGHHVDIRTFNQSRFPRVIKESLTPMPRSPDDSLNTWYPPGHGDVFESLEARGLLDELLEQGKEYLFISNVDNLGATIDLNILGHMAKNGHEFIMEVTDKTKADIKGGTLVDYEGSIRLLEIAQVPPEHTEDFKSVRKFKIFNTNNLWVSIPAIKRILENGEMDLEIITNQKSLDSGEKVIQLETAVGAAIKHFKKAIGVNVPRTRFLPVKGTSDLFLMTSDLYTLSQGSLTLNPKRLFQTVPIVKLGESFKKVGNFLQRFASAPKILELDHLTVTGDVFFGAGVTLKGTVIIVANHGSRIDIPAGAVLEDKVVSGNLRILDM